MEQALQYTQQSQPFGTDLRAYTESERKILTACSDNDNPAIKDLSMIELKAFATKLYNRASARYGNSAKNDDNAQEQIKLLVEDLMRNYLLRVKEVTYILDEGISGAYDKEDVRHFSSSRFCKWVKTYLEEIKPVAMRKKAQIDHQSLKPIEPGTSEIKGQQEAFFGEMVNKLKNNELPTSFIGFDAIYEQCEELGVFKPLDLEEKKIIASECKAYSGYDGDALKAFARKVAYLYVMHRTAGMSFTLKELIKTVSGKDTNMSGYLIELAKMRLVEYSDYKRARQKEEQEHYDNETDDERGQYGDGADNQILDL
jgi:hypothetical protein